MQRLDNYKVHVPPSLRRFVKLIRDSHRLVDVPVVTSESNGRSEEKRLTFSETDIFGAHVRIFLQACKSTPSGLALRSGTTLALVSASTSERVDCVGGGVLDEPLTRSYFIFIYFFKFSFCFLTPLHPRLYLFL